MTNRHILFKKYQFIGIPPRLLLVSLIAFSSFHFFPAIGVADVFLISKSLPDASSDSVLVKSNR